MYIDVLYIQSFCLNHKQNMKVRSDPDLFSWNVNEVIFDKAALSWYFASGKFDRNSMSRWVPRMTKPKAQILRASIDNSIIFAPIGDTNQEHQNELPGNFIVLCSNERVFALGIILSILKCPTEYKTTQFDTLIAIHVISTSFTKEIMIPKFSFEKPDDSMPQNIYTLSKNISDNLDLDIPENIELEYERQIFYANWLIRYIEELETIETPIKNLELDRLNRLSIVKQCLLSKQTAVIPRPRDFNFQKMMKTHKKYAELFGRLVY